MTQTTGWVGGKTLKAVASDSQRTAEIDSLAEFTLGDVEPTLDNVKLPALKGRAFR